MKLFTLLLVAATVNVSLIHAKETKLPNSGLSFEIPTALSLFEMDLGGALGKSDLLMDEKKEWVITFMRVPQQGKDDPKKSMDGMLAGLKSGLTKQGAKITAFSAKVNNTPITGLKAVVGKGAEIDKRLYLRHPGNGFVVLVQSPAEAEPETCAHLAAVLGIK